MGYLCCMKKRILLLLVLAFTLVSPCSLVAQDGKDKALESLGMLSGLAVYNTYVAIGAIGDGYESEAYDGETVVALMDEQKAVLTTIINDYDELLASGFITAEDDKAFVADTKEICSILKTMADHLSAYTRDKSETNSTAFQSARESAWNKIAVLLDIEQ